MPLAAVRLQDNQTLQRTGRASRSSYSKRWPSPARPVRPLCSRELPPMPDSSEKLTRWTDPELGALEWDDRDGVWVARALFGGREVRLELDPDAKAPSRDEQLAVIAPAAKLLVALRLAEPGLRRQAADQIAEAVEEQQSEIRLARDRFAATLVLGSVSLHGSGELHYRSDEFFPGQSITVYFEDDLSFGGAEVYEV